MPAKTLEKHQDYDINNDVIRIRNDLSLVKNDVKWLKLIVTGGIGLLLTILIYLHSDLKSDMKELINKNAEAINKNAEGINKNAEGIKEINQKLDSLLNK